MRRKQPKPFSEMSKAEQIAEAKAAIDRLRHPHNRYQPNIYAAIDRWQTVLKERGEPTY